MNIFEERNRSIWKEFQEIRQNYSSPTEVHEALATKHGISASRVRHIISDMRKESPLITPVEISSEFPDKKISKRTYEQVVEQIRTVQRYKSETSVSQDRATWIPKPLYPDLPIALCWMPDVHFGSLETDYDFLERHLEIITSTPNMYNAFGGDLTDNYNAIKHATGIWGDGVSPEDQMAALAYKLTELDEKKKTAAIVWGNHDEFSAMAGINPFSSFFRHVSCPLFVDGGGVLVVKVGQQEYRLGLRHTHWGTSKLNITNSPKRMMQFWQKDLDASFVGHVHTAAGEDFTFAGEQRIAVVGGTYKLMDSYGKKWIGDSHPAGFTLLMYPDQKKMQLCRYPEDAQDIILGKIARREGLDARA